uniref:Uncharacterized protein n=1 Tax=Meloidogyne hapla TaxID=6305 RepID=A0A1I8BAU0_MELHA
MPQERMPLFGSSAALHVSTTGHFHNSLNFGTHRGAHGRETSHYQQAAIFELGAMILQNMFG